MNMKKTIAAVAAGAVAVSAMATTVSAVQDQTLTYSLVNHLSFTNKNKVSIKAVFPTATSGMQISLNERSATWNKTTNTYDLGTWNTGVNHFDIKGCTMRVIDNEQAEQNRTYTYVTDAGSANYNRFLSDAGLTIQHELDFLGGTGTVEITFDCETDLDNLTAVNRAIQGWSDPDHSWAWCGNTAEITAVGYDVNETIATAFTAGTDTKYELPFVTGPNGNQNVAYYLQNNKVRQLQDGSYTTYSNVLPVLNDAIANYETVTFTFHTATKPIAWMAAKKNTNGDITAVDGEAMGPSKSSWSNTRIKRSAFYDSDNYPAVDMAVSGYNTALQMANGNANGVVAIYAEDWYGDSSYMSFTQHLYNGEANIYGPQAGWGGMGEGYVGFDWAGQNLFGGALVINENLTMSLSDIDYFDWTATTLSFDWDAIMDGAATSNQYATYVQSIKLATSVTWYWDSMDVVLVAGGETESADVAASTESEDETLDETPTEDEELTEDEPVEDEPVEDEPVEDEPVEDEPVEDEPVEDEPAPVEDVPAPAPNPTTGNAPVALAVIPVALAAAAVVAKKRG